MIETHGDGLRALLNRFHGFEDAVVRRVSVTMRPGVASDAVCRVVLSAFDTEKDPQVDDGWANVALEIGGVREMTLSHGLRGQDEVLEGGLHAAPFEGLTFFTFNAWRAPATITEARAAKSYIAGTTCKWMIGPYSESGT